MKKKLSTFTKNLLNLVFLKAKNGYPKCGIHEVRRIPKKELEEMDYVMYDGNTSPDGTTNYEIYRKHVSHPRRGDYYIYYNSWGREVKDNPERWKKKGRGRNAEHTVDEKASHYVEVHTYWDKEDIENSLTI